MNEKRTLSANEPQDPPLPNPGGKRCLLWSLRELLLDRAVAVTLVVNLLLAPQLAFRAHTDSIAAARKNRTLATVLVV